MHVSPSFKPTILLVEDYADAREMLRLLLEDLNYQVLEAKNARQALELAVRHEPDLVLTDFGLPDTDGIELIRQLRRLGESMSHVPIIMLTAFDREQYFHSAIAAGCTTFLSKPIDFERLEPIIAKLITETYASKYNHR
jgi:CheY-like chemotaxis protein